MQLDKPINKFNRKLFAIQDIYVFFFSFLFFFFLLSLRVLFWKRPEIIWLFLHYHSFFHRSCVTLCRRSAKQTIPLSVLARNQTKGFWLEISGDRKWGRERQSESWTKELEEELAKGDTSDQSTPEQRDQSDEMRPRAVREDESRWVGIPGAL